MELKTIAKVECGFPTKFGLPRQSGLADIPAKIVFEKEYSDENAFRGLEGYSHIWVVWGFSGIEQKEWSPTVRPPRLGGNVRMGVFATRSPFRPNPIGLSCVRITGVEKVGDRMVVCVTGADFMNGTPVYDIKPYLPHADCVEARGGFSDKVKDYALSVQFQEGVGECLDEKERELLVSVLSQDPRPSYIQNGERVFGFLWEGKEIKFCVQDDKLTVVGIEVVK